MDADIQFGELEEQAPRPSLRPDRNRQFAVAAHGSPREGELPIFVALDVMRDMERHAVSDTRVELGGVLLGGQYVDSEGRPFVVITDSLRAEHYEATKGSFKFTHDTWAEITRQREEYPEDVQMVGWYHTHPDWGVFLSGMDMFICDNFFNKPLDVALVIDPCRDDRGFFQWTPHSAQRVRRVGGFYVMASRYRAAELEEFLALLEGEIAMPAATRFAGPSGGVAPVVHVNAPREPWLAPALLGMFALQFCFLFLLAWRMFLPPVPGAPAEQQQQLAALVAQLEKQNALRDRETAEAAQQRMLDRILARLDQNTDGLAKQLEDREREIERLTAEKAGFEAVARERALLAEEKSQLAARLAQAEETARLRGAARDELTRENSRLGREIVALKKEIAQLSGGEEPAVQEGKGGWWPTAWTSTTWTAVGLGAAVLALLLGGIALTLRLRRPEWENGETKNGPAGPNSPEED